MLHGERRAKHVDGARQGHTRSLPVHEPNQVVSWTLCASLTKQSGMLQRSACRLCSNQWSRRGGAGSTGVEGPRAGHDAAVLFQSVVLKAAQTGCRGMWKSGHRRGRSQRGRVKRDSIAAPMLGKQPKKLRVELHMSGGCSRTCAKHRTKGRNTVFCARWQRLTCSTFLPFLIRSNSSARVDFPSVFLYLFASDSRVPVAGVEATTRARSADPGNRVQPGHSLLWPPSDCSFLCITPWLWQVKHAAHPLSGMEMHDDELESVLTEIGAAAGGPREAQQERQGDQGGRRLWQSVAEKRRSGSPMCWCLSVAVEIRVVIERRKLKPRQATRSTGP